MKNLILLSFGLFIFSAQAQNDTILELFKSTQLSGKKKIELQANISSLEKEVIKDSETRYHLKKESFGVADSISLELNKEKKIIGIYFYYQYEPEFSNDTAYIHELRKYNKIISSNGKEQKANYKDGEIRITKWESKSVIFELIEITEYKKKKCYSIIIDKKMFTRPCVNLKKESKIAEVKKKLGLVCIE
jgi:hypothetical protein